MYTADEIKNIHAELQKVFTRGQVYFGGSYLYGEAGESSDLDFYFIGGILTCNFYRRHKELLFGLKAKHPEISVMLLPKFLVWFGWYYGYSVDSAGRLFNPPGNKRLIVGNCLKLAYFNYLRNLVKAGDSARNTAKAWIELSAAPLVARAPQVNEPFFSAKYLQDRGALLSGDFLFVAEKVTFDLWNFLRFSPANYLIYNIKFGLRGDFRFLFKNPDRYIVAYLRRALKNGKNLDIIYPDIKKIVFPVIIL